MWYYDGNIAWSTGRLPLMDLTYFATFYYYLYCLHFCCGYIIVKAYTLVDILQSYLSRTWTVSNKKGISIGGYGILLWLWRVIFSEIYLPGLISPRFKNRDLSQLDWITYRSRWVYSKVPEKLCKYADGFVRVKVANETIYTWFNGCNIRSDWQ